MIVGFDQTPLDIELLLDSSERRLAVPAAPDRRSLREYSGSQIARRVGTAVICRQHDQRIVETNLFVYKCQNRSASVLSKRRILSSASRLDGPKHVADVVGRREADAQVVGDLILTQLFFNECVLRKVQHQLVASGAQRKPGCEIGAAAVTVVVRKYAPKPTNIGLPRAIIGVAKQVAALIVKQVPRRCSKSLRRFRAIELRTPSQGTGRDNRCW